MDFLDREKVFTVPYNSTLFIMNEGLAHEKPMRRDAEKERMLPTLQFIENREVGYLVFLKWDGGLRVSCNQHHLGS